MAASQAGHIGFGEQKSDRLPDRFFRYNHACKKVDPKVDHGYPGEVAGWLKALPC
jgi:hypothetical protein